MRQIKSMLLFHGMDLSEAGNEPWSVAFVQRLGELDLGYAELNPSLQVMLNLYDYLNQEKKRLTQEVAELGRQPRYAHRVNLFTYTGNARVRAVLVESSWFLIAKDASMRAKYEKIRGRRGGKRAIVAVARLLSMRIRRMLLDDVMYRIEQRPAA